MSDWVLVPFCSPAFFFEMSHSRFATTRRQSALELRLASIGLTNPGALTCFVRAAGGIEPAMTDLELAREARPEFERYLAAAQVSADRDRDVFSARSSLAMYARGAQLRRWEKEARLSEVASSTGLLEFHCLVQTLTHTNEEHALALQQVESRWVRCHEIA